MKFLKGILIGLHVLLLLGYLFAIASGALKVGEALVATAVIILLVMPSLAKLTR